MLKTILIIIVIFVVIILIKTKMNDKKEEIEKQQEKNDAREKKEQKEYNEYINSLKILIEFRKKLLEESLSYENSENIEQKKKKLEVVKKAQDMGISVFDDPFFTIYDNVNVRDITNKILNNKLNPIFPNNDYDDDYDDDDDNYNYEDKNPLEHNYIIRKNIDTICNLVSQLDFRSKEEKQNSFERSILYSSDEEFETPKDFINPELTEEYQNGDNYEKQNLMLTYKNKKIYYCIRILSEMKTAPTFPEIFLSMNEISKATTDWIDKYYGEFNMKKIIQAIKQKQKQNDEYDDILNS